MPDDMMSIGEIARASGLSVSALRFYDGARVLTPATVDPRSGYRRYSRGQLADARLVARLRRVGMPVADLRVLLAHRTDRPLVAAVLSGHLANLEAGLAAARTELETIMTDLAAAPTAFTIGAADLGRALDSVRFALPGDTEPVLDAVLLDVAADHLTAVATDRYRMALCAVPITERSGPAARLALAAGHLPRIAALASGAAPVRVRAGDGTAVLSAATDRVELPVAADYPDYGQVVGRAAGRSVATDVDTLRGLLVAGPVHQVPDCTDPAAVLAVDAAGGLTLLTDAAGDGFLAAVNRRYLLDALDAAPSSQLTLDLDGPVRPLAIRYPDTPDTYSVLMPVRLA